MQRSDILVLFDYMYWANRRLLDTADLLPPEQFTTPATATTTSRNLRATLVHELDVEWSWRLRLQNRGDEDGGELNAESFPDIASLRDQWRQDEAEMRAWLDTLTDEDLEAEVPGPVPRPLWHYLMHIFTHASQQQADAATILSAFGHSPGDIGFLMFLGSRDS